MYNGSRETYSRTRTLKWGHPNKWVSIMAVLIRRANKFVRSVFFDSVSEPSRENETPAPYETYSKYKEI